jgi:hypothetical protein
VSIRKLKPEDLDVKIMYRSKTKDYKGVITIGKDSWTLEGFRCPDSLKHLSPTHQDVIDRISQGMLLRLYADGQING